MVLDAPAFVPGAPGGPELLVLLLILLFVFVVPLAVIVVLVLMVSGRWGGRDDRGGESAAVRRRLAELEAEVERLKERIEDE